MTPLNDTLRGVLVVGGVSIELLGERPLNFLEIFPLDYESKQVISSCFANRNNVVVVLLNGNHEMFEGKTESGLDRCRARLANLYLDRLLPLSTSIIDMWGPGIRG